MTNLTRRHRQTPWESMMSNEVEAVRTALAELLSSLQNADLDRYKQLVSDTLTCYEPETLGNRLDGIGFHLFITARQSLPKKTGS
ncbi:MAG: hypothetical protein CMO26_08965 [Thiotrichales bacterium]|nr:hypothetical protein [Thiotrichales bacterium]